MVKRLWTIGWMWSFFLIFFMGILCLSNCQAQDMVQVTIKTTLGDIVVELDHEKAPISVDNFLAYVDSDFYNDTIFHRVISGFVIQGGGFDANLNYKTTGDPITNEAGNGLSNLAYTIAMARTSEPNSATSQFYINLVDNLNLDKTDTSAGYAVFGKVVQGQSVVDAIGAVATTPENIPMETVVMTDVSRTPDDTPNDNSNDDGSQDGGDNDDDGGGGGGSSSSSSSGGCFIDVIR